MISLKQALRILHAHLNYCNQAAASPNTKDSDRTCALQAAEALKLALLATNLLIPKIPVYRPEIGTYVCGMCGCIVGFQVRPGVKCYACPNCMQRVDWSTVEQ